MPSQHLRWWDGSRWHISSDTKTQGHLHLSVDEDLVIVHVAPVVHLMGPEHCRYHLRSRINKKLGDHMSNENCSVEPPDGTCNCVRTWCSGMCRDRQLQQQHAHRGEPGSIVARKDEAALHGSRSYAS